MEESRPSVESRCEERAPALQGNHRLDHSSEMNQRAASDDADAGCTARSTAERNGAHTPAAAASTTRANTGRRAAARPCRSAVAELAATGERKGKEAPLASRAPQGAHRGRASPGREPRAGRRSRTAGEAEVRGKVFRMLSLDPNLFGKLCPDLRFAALFVTAPGPRGARGQARHAAVGALRAPTGEWLRSLPFALRLWLATRPTALRHGCCCSRPVSCASR